MEEKKTEPYVIIIKHEIIENESSSATAPSSSTPEKQAVHNPKSDIGVSQTKTKESAKNGNMAKSLAIQYAKKGVMSAISNYGDMTGDYQTQSNFEVGAELAITAAAIVANPIVGGIGAVATYGGKIYSFIKEQKKSERAARFLSRRVGY